MAETELEPDLRADRTANGLRVGPVGVRPDTGVPPVVEYRLAVEGHLHLAGHAPDGAQQPSSIAERFLSPSQAPA